MTPIFQGHLLPIGITKKTWLPSGDHLNEELPLTANVLPIGSTLTAVRVVPHTSTNPGRPHRPCLVRIGKPNQEMR